MSVYDVLFSEVGKEDLVTSIILEYLHSSFWCQNPLKPRLNLPGTIRNLVFSIR